MVKRLVTYLLILGGIGLLYISTSHSSMERISAVRNDLQTVWGVHDCTDKGDLVNMAYLDYVTKFHSTRDYVFNRPAYNGPANVDLYMEGDSYTFKIPDTAYAGLHKYEYAWVGRKGIRYELDTSRTNILIIERVERYIRNYFGQLYVLNNVHAANTDFQYRDFSENNAQTNTSIGRLSALIPDKVDHYLQKMFNPNINSNLEYNLFNYKLLNAPRLAKAMLNYKIFNRASGDVTIADNGQQLYLSHTTDLHNDGSSYASISEQEYTALVNNLNYIYDYYKKDGFDEVYVAIIPNPVTILEPDGYNNLIPRLQHDASVKMKFIDSYTAFKQTNKVIYRPGDTHWYNEGLQTWLGIVNDTLAKWNEPR